MKSFLIRLFIYASLSFRHIQSCMFPLSHCLCCVSDLIIFRLQCFFSVGERVTLLLVLPHLKKITFIYLLYVCRCPNVSFEIRGQLWGVGSLLLMKDSERSPSLRPQDNSGHPRTHDRPSLLQTTWGFIRGKPELWGRLISHAGVEESSSRGKSSQFL